MNIVSRLLYVLLVVFALAPCSAVYAATDGVIRFEGRVVAETCTVTVNNSSSPTVILPIISKSKFSGVGSAAGYVDLTIEVKNCGVANSSASLVYDLAGRRGVMSETDLVLQNIVPSDGVLVVMGNGNPASLPQAKFGLLLYGNNEFLNTSTEKWRHRFVFDAAGRATAKQKIGYVLLSDGPFNASQSLSGELSYRLDYE